MSLARITLLTLLLPLLVMTLLSCNAGETDAAYDDYAYEAEYPSTSTGVASPQYTSPSGARGTGEFRAQPTSYTQPATQHTQRPSQRFQVIDRALGIPALDLTLPAGYRAEGFGDSGADGWGLDYLLVKLTTSNDRLALLTNSVQVRDASRVFGGASLNLKQALQQQCGQDLRQKFSQAGLRIRSGLDTWSVAEQDRDGTLYASEIVLADGRDGAAMMIVPNNPQREQLGMALSNFVVTVIGPAELSEAATEAFLTEVFGIYKSITERPQWVQATNANNRSSIAANQQQSNNFNAQLRSSFAAQQRSHQRVVEGHRRYNETVQQGMEATSRSAGAVTETLSGYERYTDPYTGEEVLINNDLGPGSRTYFSQQGEYFQTEDPIFDPYQLPDGWQAAPQNPY